ncbi:MAG: cobalamin-binding protein [Actinomycetota bacterium]
MRIASLVPSSTEILFALGLGDDVVAVTHECDYPAEAPSKPHLTRTVIPEGLSAPEIDAEVKRVTGEGRALYELDEERLAGLDPELIVTQAVCEVCAVSYDDVVAVGARLPSRPRVVSLDPSSLDEVLADVDRLAEAAGEPRAGAELRRRLEDRLAAVRERVAGRARPRVLALEWLDPPFIGGHWVPQMIEAAGGEDAIGRAAEKSREAAWEELEGLAPDVAVVMPCGYYVDEARDQSLAYRERLESLGAGRVVAVDAASAFSRPGPRLVDGIELLAHLFHPGVSPAPEGVRFAECAPSADGDPLLASESRAWQGRREGE